MRGLRRAVPPPISSPMPRWDLDTVLNYLCSEPFEPMESADLWHVTMKTVFLMFVASGRRAGELACLTRRSTGRSRLFLAWPPSFRPKNYNQLQDNLRRLGRFGPTSPSIRMLDFNDPDNVLCPVRAYRHYLARTTAPQFSKYYLWDYGDDKEKINILKLSRTFIKTVENAHTYANLSKPKPIGPHQARKLAASYGILLCNNVLDEQHLMQDMGYSSLGAMKKVYIREVPTLRCNCIVPGGTVAASTRSIPYTPYVDSAVYWNDPEN